MALVLTNGLIIDSTLASGSTITCMEKESTPGKMEEGTKVNIMTIKSMATENIGGLMAGSTKALGKREDSMVKESILLLKVKVRKESGIMEKEFNGLIEY